MSKYIIGLDIGGTKIAVGLVDVTKGKVIRKIKVPTGKKVQDGISNIIFTLDKVSHSKKYPLGIGCAGQINIEKGKVIYSPNMPQWRNVPLLKILKKNLGRNFRIKIDNDANCFTLAEWKFGAGYGYNYVIGLTLGTGIGSGAVLNGKLYHGKMNAPEIGHTALGIDGRKCKCGKFGHLEVYSSGKAIERQYFKLTGKKLIATDIEKRVYLGDKKAKAVFKEARKYLAIGIANIVANFDSEVIILGGTIGIKSNLIYRGLENLVQKNLFFKDKKILIKKAELGEDGGLIGAAMLFTLTS